MSGIVCSFHFLFGVFGLACVCGCLCSYLNGEESKAALSGGAHFICSVEFVCVCLGHVCKVSARERYRQGAGSVEERAMCLCEVLARRNVLFKDV